MISLKELLFNKAPVINPPGRLIDFDSMVRTNSAKPTNRDLSKKPCELISNLLMEDPDSWLTAPQVSAILNITIGVALYQLNKLASDGFALKRRTDDAGRGRPYVFKWKKNAKKQEAA